MEAARDDIKSEFEQILQRQDGTFEKWLASAHFQLHTHHLLQCERAQDVVHTLYVKLMDGQRKWDKEKFPDITIFFFTLIRSHVKNLAITKKMTVEYDENIDSPLRTDQDIPGQRNEFMDLCLKKLDHDENLVNIFHAFSDGLANHEVAKDLSLNIRDVENAKKRILRKLQPVYEEYFEKRGRKCELRIADCGMRIGEKKLRIAN